VLSLFVFFKTDISGQETTTMIFKQLFDDATWTYTYLIADPKTKEAVMIDPVNTQIDVYLQLLAAEGLTLKYSLETHVHADHITAGGLLRQKTGAQTAVSSLCGADTADVQIKDGDVFEFADGEEVKVIATPGHTPGSISFLWRDRLFSGDSLLIGGCGRTDFQGGNSGDLYDAITQRLFTLPDDTLVYPGHDYQGRWVSNINQERSNNPRLTGKSREQFIEIMENLNLPNPKLIDEAVPANRYCGLDEDECQDAMVRRELSLPKRNLGTAQDKVAAAKQKITEVTVETAKELIAEGNINIVDVREGNEYEAGHLDDSILLPRGVLEFKISDVNELANKSEAVLVYCRTGGRSALAALAMQELGYNNVLSMAGGFEAWSQAA
jgi:glyoxylase-like metal-dependent hydrolase (beta-lactamase superfamily II)/rhodanese-related sulfurtransferase